MGVLKCLMLAYLPDQGDGDPSYNLLPRRRERVLPGGERRSLFRLLLHSRSSHCFLLAVFREASSCMARSRRLAARFS